MDEYDADGFRVHRIKCRTCGGEVVCQSKAGSTCMLEMTAYCHGMRVTERAQHPDGVIIAAARFLLRASQMPANEQEAKGA